MTVETIETTAKATNAVRKTVAICPKCGREYSAHPAISRVDNETEICSVCGVEEALEAAGIEKEEADEIIRETEAKGISIGRVGPIKAQSLITEYDRSNDTATGSTDAVRSIPI